MKTSVMGCVMGAMLFLVSVMAVVGQQVPLLPVREIARQPGQPGYTSGQMDFMGGPNGSVLARPKGKNGTWLPLKGRMGKGTIYVSGSYEVVAVNHDDPVPLGFQQLPVPKTPKRPETTAQDAIKKLTAVPRPPDTANGGEKRWEYTQKRIDELNHRLDSLESVLNDIVKLLEKQN